MYLVGFDSLAQGGIDALMALDEALALKFAGDQGGIPVAAIALDFEVLAGQASRDLRLEFLCGHGVSSES